MRIKLEGSNVKGAKPLRWFRVLQGFHPLNERGEQHERGFEHIILEGFVYLDTSYSLVF